MVEKEEERKPMISSKKLSAKWQKAVVFAMVSFFWFTGIMVLGFGVWVMLLIDVGDVARTIVLLLLCVLIIGLGIHLIVMGLDRVREEEKRTSTFDKQGVFFVALYIFSVAGLTFFFFWLTEDIKEAVFWGVFIPLCFVFLVLFILSFEKTTKIKSSISNKKESKESPFLFAFEVLIFLISIGAIILTAYVVIFIGSFFMFFLLLFEVFVAILMTKSLFEWW